MTWRLGQKKTQNKERRTEFENKEENIISEQPKKGEKRQANDASGDKKKRKVHSKGEEYIGER